MVAKWALVGCEQYLAPGSPTFIGPIASPFMILDSSLLIMSTSVRKCRCVDICVWTPLDSILEIVSAGFSPPLTELARLSVRFRFLLVGAWSGFDKSVDALISRRFREDLASALAMRFSSFSSLFRSFSTLSLAFSAAASLSSLLAGVAAAPFEFSCFDFSRSFLLFLLLFCFGLLLLLSLSRFVSSLFLWILRGLPC